MESKKCKNCGATLKKEEKICPECNTKVRKIWPWIIVIIILLAAIIGCLLFFGKDTPTNAPISYTEYTIEELYKDLTENPEAAKIEHENEYVIIKGKFEEIDKEIDKETDKETEYIMVVPDHDKFIFKSIYGNLTTDQQKELVKDLEEGTEVKIKGQISSVDQFVGYYVDVEELTKE